MNSNHDDTATTKPVRSEYSADPSEFSNHTLNLASARLGATPVSCSDQFFAPLDRLLDDKEPIFYPDRFDDHGKWMDGWETRRRRDGGHDFAIIKLAAPGRIYGFDVDTAHFTGNFAPAVQIEACHAKDGIDDGTRWTEVLPFQSLGPDAHHYFRCDNTWDWTHLRVNIYPDGGIARLRVFGLPRVGQRQREKGDIDLVAALSGGRIIAVSDHHFGDYTRINAPGPGLNMGDGWETRRRRRPGYDWMILSLGLAGIVSRVEVDTAFFKGNFPDSCSVQVADMTGFQGNIQSAIIASSMFWKDLIGQQKLSADSKHAFDVEDPDAIGRITHVRLNIFPDGGVSRFRMFGKAV